MKKSLVVTFALFFTISLLPSRLARAASLEPTTGYTNSFTNQPTVADWTSYSRAGAGTNEYDVDLDVNANVTLAVATNTTLLNANNPASQNRTRRGVRPGSISRPARRRTATRRCWA
jgi:hypothetical protein